MSILSQLTAVGSLDDMPVSAVPVPGTRATVNIEGMYLGVSQKTSVPYLRAHLSIELEEGQAPSFFEFVANIDNENEGQKIRLRNFFSAFGLDDSDFQNLLVELSESYDASDKGLGKSELINGNTAEVILGTRQTPNGEVESTITRFL